MHTLDDFTPGQMVVLPSGEHGRVSRVDDDENMVYVDVATATGIDTVDVDPAELRPRD
jgi:preprotein translocase subunit YajC